MESHIVKTQSLVLRRLHSHPWMLSKISSFGHGRLEIQPYLAHPHVPCGTTNLGCSKDGYPKVCFLFFCFSDFYFFLHVRNTDPREASGYCAPILGTTLLFNGNYPSTATGGVSQLDLFCTCNLRTIIDNLGWCWHP